MLHTLRKYADFGRHLGYGQVHSDKDIDGLVLDERSIMIWEARVGECRSLLVLRQAELLLAKAQLTGNEYCDSYIQNRIQNLDLEIANLKRWLDEAQLRTENQRGQP
jgi:hypothetical protein